MQNRKVYKNPHTNLLQLEEHMYPLVDVDTPNVFRNLFPYDEVPKIEFNERIVPHNLPDDIFITELEGSLTDNIGGGTNLTLNYDTTGGIDGTSCLKITKKANTNKGRVGFFIPVNPSINGIVFRLSYKFDRVLTSSTIPKIALYQGTYKKHQDMFCLANNEIRNYTINLDRTALDYAGCYNYTQKLKDSSNGLLITVDLSGIIETTDFSIFIDNLIVNAY
jgi:hypothetical protein